MAGNVLLVQSTGTKYFRSNAQIFAQVTMKNTTEKYLSSKNKSLHPLRYASVRHEACRFPTLIPVAVS